MRSSQWPGIITSNVSKRSAKFLPIAASILAIAALLLVPLVFKLDGNPHADWQQFLGRFHVLAVHLPIGLILLVPLLEIGGRFRPALCEAAALILSLTVFVCVGTFTLGYLLAYGSGTMGAGSRATCGAASGLRSAFWSVLLFVQSGHPASCPFPILGCSPAFCF